MFQFCYLFFSKPLFFLGFFADYVSQHPVNKYHVNICSIHWSLCIELIVDMYKDVFISYLYHTSPFHCFRFTFVGAISIHLLSRMSGRHVFRQRKYVIEIYQSYNKMSKYCYLLFPNSLITVLLAGDTCIHAHIG